MAFSPFPNAEEKPKSWRYHIAYDEWREGWIDIGPEEIAYYAHCRSGMTPMEFVSWLTNELVTLESIDPECSK